MTCDHLHGIYLGKHWRCQRCAAPGVEEHVREHVNVEDFKKTIHARRASAPDRHEWNKQAQIVEPFLVTTTAPTEEAAIALLVRKLDLRLRAPAALPPVPKPIGVHVKHLDVTISVPSDPPIGYVKEVREDGQVEVSIDPGAYVFTREELERVRKAWPNGWPIAAALFPDNGENQPPQPKPKPKPKACPTCTVLTRHGGNAIERLAYGLGIKTVTYYDAEHHDGAVVFNDLVRPGCQYAVPISHGLPVSGKVITAGHHEGRLVISRSAIGAQSSLLSRLIVSAVQDGDTYRNSFACAP